MPGQSLSPHCALSLYISQLTLPPSLTFTLSLSLPHELSLSLMSSLSLQCPRVQIPIPESIPRPRKLQIRVEDHLPRVFLPGELWISSSSRGGKARSRYSNLCRPDLCFQEVLSDFFWSINSICIPQLGSKRVSILVGQFFPKKDFCFWRFLFLAENVLVGTSYPMSELPTN